MHTFAQKPKATQHTPSAKPLIRGRAHPAQSPEVRSILTSQHMIGNQVVRGSVQTDAGQLGAELTGPVSPRLGHEFSRITIHPRAAGAIQTRLAMNEPGDRYEREADRVAEQVMGTPEPRFQGARTCRGACPKAHSELAAQEHERLQTKRVHASSTGHSAAPPIVREVVAGPGKALDPATRRFMESRFGYDFSIVRLHSDATAAQSARDVNAHAYTVGHHIVFGAGRFQPETHDGRRLLAHELTHVVQQAGTMSLQRQSAGPIRTGKILSLKEVNADPKRKHARKLSGQTVAKVCRSTSKGAGKANCPATLQPGLKVTIVAEKAGGAWLQITTPEKVPGFGPKEPLYVMAAFVEETTTEAATPQSGGPVIKDILRLDQTVPVKGLVKNQPNYVDHFSGRLESAPVGRDITLFPKTGPASQTGISIPKGDFYLDADPLAGGSMGQNQVYKSRAVAEAVVLDLMKQTPDWPVYTYYTEGGLILPTTLSDTTIPNLMPFIRQKRDEDLAAIKASADLAEDVMWWYVDARFPIKIRPGGGGAGQGGKEAVKQLEREAAKRAEQELAKAATGLARQMAAKHGKVVVNLGGTGEVANAINVNPLTAQRVKDIPNLVRAGAEKVGTLFKPGTVDKIVSNDIVFGTVNWLKTAKGSFVALKSGGQVSIAPYAGSLAEHLAQIQAALKAAGFKDIKVLGGRVITAVKP